MRKRGKSQIISGIYGIFHKESGRAYIGSAVNISRRWYRHRNELKSNTHHCLYLQRAWNKYGEEAFEFKVLETCLPEKTCLFSREDYWMQKHRKKRYNSGDHPEANAGMPVSEERRKRISEANKNRVNHKPHYAKRITDEIMLRIAEDYANGDMLKTIAIRHDVSYRVIYGIIHEERGNLKPLPEEIRSAIAIRSKIGMARADTNLVSVIDVEQAKEIKVRLERGEIMTEIACHMGITKHIVRNIQRGRTFSYVEITDSDRQKVLTPLPTTYKAKPKLTIDDIRDIKQRISVGESLSSIARLYNISVSITSGIKHDKIHKHIV